MVRGALRSLLHNTRGHPPAAIRWHSPWEEIVTEPKVAGVSHRCQGGQPSAVSHKFHPTLEAKWVALEGPAEGMGGPVPPAREPRDAIGALTIRGVAGTL